MFLGLKEMVVDLKELMKVDCLQAVHEEGWPWWLLWERLFIHRYVQAGEWPFTGSF